MDQKISNYSEDTDFIMPPDRETIIQRLWRYKTYFIVPVVLCLLFGAFLVSAMIANQGSQTYNYKIRLSFSGVQDGKYPNGEDFHIRDIIAPNVVRSVYRKHIAGQYKISGEDFRSALTISSYSPATDLVLKRFETMLANRRITPAQATQIQLELADALKVQRRSAAAISFQNSRLNLPDGIVYTVLESVVEEWNNFSIEKRGVLDLNISGLEPSFLSSKFLDGSSEINRLQTLVEMYKKVQTQVEQVGKFEIANSLRDAQTGSTFVSLSSQLKSVEGRIIDLARSWLIEADDKRPLMPGLLSSNAFGDGAINGLDAQIAYDLLLERIVDIRRNIDKLSELEGTSVTDPATGVSISDLRNILNEMETFQIRPLRDAVLQSGQSKSPDAVRSYYQQRIREFELERKEYVALANVVDQVDNRFERSTVNSSTVATGGASSQSQRSTTVIPQFDDGFLDRLIDMSSQGDESKFRQELARKSIELLESVARVDSKIAGLKSDLAIFEKGLSVPETENTNTVSSSANESLRNLLRQLRNHLEVTVRIGQRILAAEQMKSVLSSSLGLSSFDARLERRAFLRSDDVRPMTVKDIIEPLTEILEISNRLTKDLSTELFGTASLSDSFHTPQAMKQPIVSRQSIFTMVAALFLGLLIGAALVAMRYFRLR